MTIDKKIVTIDWLKYTGPEYYNPTNLVQSLIDINNLHNEENITDLGDRILSSLGNNHSGTYYPAILEAAGILIEIAEKHLEVSVRTFVQAVLNDLYYFQPELGTYIGHSKEEIKLFVESTLFKYSDEYMEKGTNN